MKFGVITFPGSNCDQDIIYVLRDILMQPVEELWHKDTDLKGCDFVILPGGFSYGDYLRSGAIANFSPIMAEVVKHANAGGYVMGICNGFQILCESGLLPGVLRHNENQKFICKNVHIKPASNSNIVTQNLDEYKAYKIPVAHAEGNFFATPEQMLEIHDNEQVLFRYCNEEAEVTNGSNPNGSLENIAGICNKNRNVFGMMPHPERASDFELFSTDGREIFDGMLNATLV